MQARKSKRKSKRKRKPGRKLKLTKRLRIPKIDHEKYLKKRGFKRIVGVDEVGRGAWAGPLVAAAVMLPQKRLYSIRDSKLLTPKERRKLSAKIKRSGAKTGIGIVWQDELDKIGLSKATFVAFARAVKKLRIKTDFVLTDTFRIPDFNIPQRPIKKGDMFCASIAAASIVAKVERDKIMRKLAKKYRGYYFERNKGYGTRRHRKQIKKYGICEIHRKCFAPIKKYIK
jgi:ribonuclease HII